jgi:hypothetical protein
MMLVPVFAGGSAVGPGGPFYTSAVWRAATTFSCLAVILLGMLSVVAAARAWREQMSVRSKLSFAAAVMSGSALILLMLLAWLPFLWRNSAWGTGHLAVRLRGAGIAVQSSLVVYELSEPGARERVVREPAFTWLTPRAQLLWRRMIEEPGAGFLPPRFPEFTRRLAGTLHVHGVQILAGTDAMGLPLIVPGSSLLRELHLLHQSGLTPYDVLRTATVAPAAFLGKEAEFGAIAIGRRADLLLLERNPLEDLSALTGLRGVMVRGRWLPRERLDEMLGALR